jgi:hypothetical protein
LNAFLTIFTRKSARGRERESEGWKENYNFRVY